MVKRTPEQKELDFLVAYGAASYWPQVTMTGRCLNLSPELQEFQSRYRLPRKQESVKLTMVDFVELEKRVAAWHKDVVEKLEADGFVRQGDGPLSDCYVKTTNASAT